MWKCTVLLLLALAPSVNSTGTPKPKHCAVCLEKDCADAVRRIYPANSHSNIPAWRKGTEEIPNCSMDNLKPNAPCQKNGSLVQQTNERLHFEGKDSSGEPCSFTSVNMPCADLGLPSSSKPSPVIKSLIGTYTAVNPNEFTSVLRLDGEAVDSYNSNGTVSMPRRNWMREGKGHDLWESVKRSNMEHWNRGRTDIFKNYTRLNVSGAAVLQGRFGCEIERNPDSPPRLMSAFAQYGWNGQDFLSFNLNHGHWVASLGSAVPIKIKWNSDQSNTMKTAYYIGETCVNNLLDILFYEAKESQITAQPTAAVFAKRSLNPVKVMLTCLVSGSHCRNTMVEVYWDDDIITEECDDILSSGIRPNGDGTCQLRKSLDISDSTEASYSCEVQFGILKQRVKWDGKIWDRATSRQDYNMRHLFWLLMAPLVLAIILSLQYWRGGSRWMCCTRSRELLAMWHPVSNMEANATTYTPDQQLDKDGT